MRVLMKMENERTFVVNIDSAEAEWDDKEKGRSSLTMYGYFHVEDGKFVDRYTIHFRNEIAFSLCKKLEQEGIADLSTNYMRGYITHEYYPDID